MFFFLRFLGDCFFFVFFSSVFIFRRFLGVVVFFLFSCYGRLQKAESAPKKGFLVLDRCF